MPAGCIPPVTSHTTLHLKCQANFHFFVQSRDYHDVSARVSVVAKKTEAGSVDDVAPHAGMGGWMFQRIEVDVDGVKIKRPIRIDRGE